jgi:thioredoxin reductase
MSVHIATDELAVPDDVRAEAEAAIEAEAVAYQAALVKALASAESGLHHPLRHLTDRPYARKLALLLLGADSTDWDETKHPRDAHGRFGQGAGAFGRSTETPTEHQRSMATAEYERLNMRWAEVNNKLLAMWETPDSPEARALVEQQKDLCKQMYKLDADPGGLAGVGLPGGPRDVVIVGAGPAGLASAIMSGTDGLDTLLIEATERPGGQAKSSSRIENYPGFPIGIPGRALTGKMIDAAERVGAEMKLGTRVTGLEYDPKTGLKRITLSNGETVETRAVVIAGGLKMRTMTFPGSDANGIVYDGEQLQSIGAGKHVVVVGGSNGAAQAALGAAQTATGVTLLSRSPVVNGMSKYQIVGLKANPKTTVMEHAEVAAVEKDASGNMKTVVLKDGQRIEAGALGIFVGAVPETSWLPASVSRDAATGKLKTDARTYSTNIPGVFAAGDVRHDSIGRIGASVGEGQKAEHSVFGYFNKLKAQQDRAAAKAGAKVKPRITRENR